MPAIRPIPAIRFSTAAGRDLSAKIAPPYDVLDETGKAAFLKRDPKNIVLVDLPHLPAKTVGPDSTYEAAGKMYRQWLADGTLVRDAKPAVFVYQQSYTHAGKTFKRRGLIANVTVQPFGKSADGKGGIHPHEQTFSGPKEDRMKLMRATQAQLSPIFGLHSDPQNKAHALLTAVIDAGAPTFSGTTPGDGVLHDVWAVSDPAKIKPFTDLFQGADIFIADGHHRYTTALNYRQQLIESRGSLPADHPANFCLFVLIAMQDPGMIVLPTHRVLGNMARYSIDTFTKAAAGALKLTPFDGSLEALETSLPKNGPHAIGVYDSATGKSFIATTTSPDPLAATHGNMSAPWRQLDVAIVQHLYVESICQAKLAEPGATVTWKFPHTVADAKRDAHAPGYQLALILQSTPLESVRLVSEAGELMPQKSTFFYPKLATGLVINPLE